MTGILASVNCLQEAQQALNVGVDIIDLKQPARGALGALTTNEVSTIVKAIAQRIPVSATIGDLPMHPDRIYTATSAMAATGVDYVKIGFFPDAAWHETLVQLHKLSKANVRLIAVLFADQQPDFKWVEQFADCGFTGVMLDTMDKSNGSLTTILNHEKINRFVKLAQDQQLICGLAGSLQIADVAYLLPLQADYLGFRGALCKAGNRTSTLDLNAVTILKQTLTQSSLSTPVSTHVQ